MHPQPMLSLRCLPPVYSSHACPVDALLPESRLHNQLSTYATTKFGKHSGRVLLCLFVACSVSAGARLVFKKVALQMLHWTSIACSFYRPFELARPSVKPRPAGIVSRSLQRVVRYQVREAGGVTRGQYGMWTSCGWTYDFLLRLRRGLGVFGCALALARCLGSLRVLISGVRGGWGIWRCLTFPPPIFDDLCS